jgi:hypothetical protein
MTGPFLYDDGPAPLHTGTPRRRPWLLLAIFGGTAVVAVLMVVALPLLKGSADEQARESVGVFLAALGKGDTETAHGLLCDDERARLAPDEVAGAYLAGEGGHVVGTEEAEEDGESVQHVRVGWDDRSATTLTVVREDGPRICGTD